MITVCRWIQYGEDLENLSEDERKAFMDFVGEVDELDEENMSAWWD